MSTPPPPTPVKGLFPFLSLRNLYNTIRTVPQSPRYRMVQFNPAITPQIKQGNSESPALRSKCEEVDIPLDAKTTSNPPTAAPHEDVAGGIILGTLTYGGC